MLEKIDFIKDLKAYFNGSVESVVLKIDTFEE